MTAAVLIRGGPRAPSISGSSKSAPLIGQQHRVGAGSMSFEKFFNDRFARFLRENFTNPTQVAAAFGVRERTAENWWTGLNCPGGAKVALAFALWPKQAGRHLAGAGNEGAEGEGSWPRDHRADGAQRVGGVAGRETRRPAQGRGRKIA